MNRKNRVSLTREEKRELARLYCEEGLTYAELMVKYNVSHPTVQRAIRDYRALKCEKVEEAVAQPEVPEPKLPLNPPTTFHLYLKCGKVLDITGTNATLDLDSSVIKIYFYEKEVAVISDVIGYVDNEYRNKMKGQVNL